MKYKTKHVNYQKEESQQGELAMSFKQQWDNLQYSQYFENFIMLRVLGAWIISLIAAWGQVFDELHNVTHLKSLWTVCFWGFVFLLFVSWVIPYGGPGGPHTDKGSSLNHAI